MCDCVLTLSSPPFACVLSSVASPRTLSSLVGRPRVHPPLQFESLIETKPLTLAFPEYTGPQELRPCIEYIANQFAAKLKPTRAKPMVLLMAARVKKDVQYCFEDVKDTLIDINRKGIRRAQAKLDNLRDQYRQEQLAEMERAAVEKKMQQLQLLKMQQAGGTTSTPAGTTHGRAPTQTTTTIAVSASSSPALA